MFGRRPRTIRRRGIGCLIRLIVMLVVFIAVLVLQSRAQAEMMPYHVGSDVYVLLM